LWKFIMTRIIISPGRRSRRGSASIVGVIFLVTIACLGMIVGLAHVRDQIVQEFGDAAVALDHLDQSFSVTITINGEDYVNAYSDPGPNLVDEEGEPPAGIFFDPMVTGEAPVSQPDGTLP